MSALNEESSNEERHFKVLPTVDIPSGEQQPENAFSDEAVETVNFVVRPDALINPLTDAWVRVLTALLVALLIGVFLFSLFVSGLETMSRLFSMGSANITLLDILTFAGITGLGAVVLTLVLHPLMRSLVESKIPARTMDASQRALLEMLPSPAFFLDDQACIQDFNSAFARALGRSDSGLLGTAFRDFVPEDEQEDADQDSAKVVSGESSELHCHLATKKGTRLFQISGEPFKGNNSDELQNSTGPLIPDP